MKLNLYGNTLIKNIENRFYKSFNSLNIDIKDNKITIKNKPVKVLVDNIYLPPVINSGYNGLFNQFYNKFKSKS